MFNNVLVGIDGEDGGRDALALARTLVGESGRLTLAHVYPGDAFIWRGTSPAYQAAEEEDVLCGEHSDSQADQTSRVAVTA